MGTFRWIGDVSFACRWLSGEEVGWVAPLVTSHNYVASWQPQTQTDWSQLDIRYSIPAYLNTSGVEWTSLTFPFINARYRNRVLYYPTGIERPARPYGVAVTPSADFGTGTLPASLARDWTVMLSMKNTSVGAASPWQNKINVVSFQCPPGGCVVPPPAVVGALAPWSSPSSWPSGTVPVVGQDVVINSTMNILLDVSPPTLGRLTVLGRLAFQDFGADSPPLVLSVGQIVVWGQFVVGNATQPYLGSAHVVLNGDRYSGGSVVVDNATPPLGNKNIVVLGKLSAVGAPVNATWVRLAQTAYANSTQVVLSKPVAWVPGQPVAVTPTNYDATQLEDLYITAVSRPSSRACG